MPASSRNSTSQIDEARLCVFRAAGTVGGAGRGVYGREVLSEMCRDMAPDKARFARALYTVCTKRALTLDSVIACMSGRPSHAIQPALRQVLRQGACEILFMTSVPPYAAVDQAVSLARHVARKRAGGFANAVLRRLAAALESRDAPCPFTGGIAAGIQSALAGDEDVQRRAVPNYAGQWVVAKEAILPVLDSPAAYLSIVLSYPVGFAKRLVGHYGLARATDIMMAGNEPPPLFLRINPLRTTEAELLGRLEDAGLSARLFDEGFLLIESARSVEKIPGYTEGLFSVQDPSQAAVCRALAPREGELVLDLCAAPGGKACHMAEMTADGCLIVAVDRSENRLRLAQANAGRLRLSHLHSVVADALSPECILSHPADRVLVDVPCTNSGALRRRAEARWRLDAQRVRNLAAQAAGMLEGASRTVTGGGSLAYATCSILPEENEHVAADFLRRNRAFKPVAQEAILPAPGRPDGAFFAVFRRGQGK